jgi:hypothetical protein
MNILYPLMDRDRGKNITNCSSRQLTLGDFGLVGFSDYVALLKCCVR